MEIVEGYHETIKRRLFTTEYPSRVETRHNTSNQHIEISELFSNSLIGEIEKYSKNIRGGNDYFGIDSRLNLEAFNLWNELRAERDTWSLLSYLSRSELIGKEVSEALCEIQQAKGLKVLSVKSSIPDFINAAYRFDDRLKQSAVLKQWLENGASDLTSDYPISIAEPWSTTLNEINRNNPATPIKSVHPDCQFLFDGTMLPLVREDQIDQEQLLKHIWQLIRSGQLVRAQQSAFEHRIYWLASILQGVATHDFQLSNPLETVSFTDNQHSSHAIIQAVGNTRQPIWLQTAWRYSQKMASNPANWNTSNTNFKAFLLSSSPMYSSTNRPKSCDSLVGILEMTIHAALSNNTKVLIKSPFIQSWEDKLWVYVKATHDRDLTDVIHLCRCKKHGHSSYYPGCDIQTITAEREWLQSLKMDLHLTSHTNIYSILMKCRPPLDNPTEFFLLELQSSIITGTDGIHLFIKKYCIPFLNYLNSPQDVTSNQSPVPNQFKFDQLNSPLILRVVCHFAIWLKFFPNPHQTVTNHPSPATPLNALISDALLYDAIENYITYLILSNHKTSVALYAALLSRPRRIAKYIELLLSMRTHPLPDHVSNEECYAILLLGSNYFPNDLLDVTRCLVQYVNQIVSECNDVQLFTPVRIRNPTRPPLPSSGQKQLTNTVSSPKIPSFQMIDSSNSFQKKFICDEDMKNALYALPMMSDNLTIRSSLKEKVQILQYQNDSELKAVDVLRIDSLRWLFFDPNHRVEAMKQLNHLVVQFLLENQCSHIVQVTHLLDEFISKDVIMAGDEIMKQRHAFTKEIAKQFKIMKEQKLQENDIYIWFESIPMAMEPLNFRNIQSMEQSVQSCQRQVTLSEQEWNVSIQMVYLWRSIVDTFQEFKLFQQSFKEYFVTSSTLLGNESVRISCLARFRNVMDRAGTIAVASIIEVFIGTSDGSDGKLHSGLHKVWQICQDSLLGTFRYHVDVLETIFSRIFSTLSMPENILSIKNMTTPTRRETKTAATTLQSNFEMIYDLHNALFGNSDNNDNNSIMPSLESLGKMMTIMSSDVVDSEEDYNVLLLAINNTVSACKYILLEIKDTTIVLRQVLSHLLMNYLEIVQKTAEVMESLKDMETSKKWYTEGLQLSDLIASEDDKLQLYTMLTRKDLESLLTKIGLIATNLLRLDPTMNQFIQP